MGDSSSDECQEKPKKYGKTIIDVQRETIEKLMNDPYKETNIPDLKEEGKLPRAFHTHEFVRNVMGASAGAGSGEFDIYRGCRNRELARQEYLKELAEKEKAQKEFEEKRLKNMIEAEKKTAKKRAKRLKSKFKKISKSNKDNENNQENENEEKEVDDKEQDEEIDLNE